jgi:predicted Zn-dependent protease
MLAAMPRLLVVLLSLAACAWFALGIRQAHDVNAATAIIAGHTPLSPGQARRARALLRQAGRLNPDANVELLRAQLALRQGDARRARAIAASVTRSEPQNIQAWLAYGRASAHDPRGFALALRHLNELAPTVGHSG